jgi:hypothetical protein
MLQENLGTKYDMCSIFKPSDPHAKLVMDIGNIYKGLTKQDHIIIVGGPGNSLDRNYPYSIENFLNFIAEGTSNTSVGYVNRFENNDKIWIGGRVSSMNLWLYRNLIRHDMSHIGLTDTSSNGRDDYIHYAWPAPKFSRQQEAHPTYCCQFCSW